jgi:GMP synthase (glutamine-hydrolysing)
MHLHYLQHVPFEGLGSIETWTQAAGFQISATRLYAQDRLPAMDEIDWLVVMGGPMNIYEEIQHPWLKQEKAFISRAIAKGKVVLGICLGAQLVADVLGAKVFANHCKEIGWFPVYKTKDAARTIISDVMPDTMDVLHWHGDTFDLPAAAVHLARSEACANQGFVYEDRIIGLQFHLETTAPGLQSLITHCIHDIDDSRFVQPPEKMAAEPERFKQVNQVMDRLLDRLAKLNG